MVSRSVEYSLRAMRHLALQPGVSVTSEALSRATGVPQGYLSKIMRELVCAELVRSFRGPHGGFALAREPGTISVLDIVNAVDGVRRSDAGASGASPQSVEQCLDGAKHTMERAFRRATLATLLQESRPSASTRRSRADESRRSTGDAG